MTESATVHFSAHMFRQRLLYIVAVLLLVIPTSSITATIVYSVRLPFTLYTMQLPIICIWVKINKI